MDLVGHTEKRWLNRSTIYSAVCHMWNVFLFLLQEPISRNEKGDGKKSEYGCIAEQLSVRTGVYRHTV